MGRHKRGTRGRLPRDIQATMPGAKNHKKHKSPKKANGAHTEEPHVPPPSVPEPEANGSLLTKANGSTAAPEIRAVMTPPTNGVANPIPVSPLSVGKPLLEPPPLAEAQALPWKKYLLI